MQTDYRFGDAELRPRERLLLVGGKRSHIGARAFDVLLALVEQRDRVVAKNELLDRVWPGLVVEENNLQVHISNLRKVLGEGTIATIPGRGYRFTAALSQERGAQREDGAPAANDAKVHDAHLHDKHSHDTHPHETQLHDTHASDALVRGPTNLPLDPSPLFGRESELRELRALLASHRLVTITGGGGIGKTALAQTLACELREDFDDGVWQVELSPVASPSLVTNAVASVLRVDLGTEAPAQSLARALSASRMLIVLDNCEHVAAAVAELALALHRIAPGVRLLATSQEPLKLAHEHLYRLGPLDVPSDDAHADARRSGAVALFGARALAADPRFALDSRNLGAVAEICRQLDGIPLALELAAARLPLLGVDGLRARLAERFRVLKGSARDALPRHQTLRAAMEWSHGLLTRDEQVVLRRLAVFAGGFRLESAQHVARDTQLDEWAVLELLAALVDKSMVVAQGGTQPRYKLLETTRAFAREMLQSSGEMEAIRRRHCEAVLAIYDASYREELLTPRQKLLPGYLPDLDNARAALDWAAGPDGDAELQVALAGAIAWIWDPTGLHHEGLRRTREALARMDDGMPMHLRARLLAVWCCVAWPEVGPTELERTSRAIDLFRRLGDRVHLYRSLCDYCRRLGVMLRFDEAERVLQEAQALYDPHWPRPLYGMLLTARACNLLERGEAEACEAAYRERYELALELGDRALELASLVNIEQSCAMSGRWEESAQRGYQLLELLSGDRSLRQSNEIYVVSNLCMALTRLGRLDEAMEMARRSLTLHLQWGHMVCAIDQFALLVFKRGHPRDAARMLGHADAIYARTGQFRQAVEMKLHDALLEDLRGALEPGELARLIEEGDSLSDEAAAGLVLREQDGRIAARA